MKNRGRTNFANRNLCAAFLVDLTGIEPATLRMRTVRSPI